MAEKKVKQNPKKCAARRVVFARRRRQTPTRLWPECGNGTLAGALDGTLTRKH